MSLKVLEALDVLRNAVENDFERHRLDILINDLTAPPTVETIDDTHKKFNGEIYRKDSNGHFHKSTFIHRVIWSYNYGEIPQGDYVIHHINENKSDNNIENLQLLTRNEHRKKHTETLEAQEYICQNCGVKFLAKQTTAKFCSAKCSNDYHYHNDKRICSICGKTFSATHKRTHCCSRECVNIAIGKANIKEPLKKICPICGKVFIDPHHPNKKCCSSECGAKFGWKNSSRKLKEKTCPICGKNFTPKESRIICCSKSCGAKLRFQQKN